MSSTFDPSSALLQMDQDRDLLKEIIGLFLEDNPKREADLRAALARGDAKLLERTAHTIKGSCVLLGASEAQKAAHELELLGRAGDFAKASQAVQALAKETELLTRDLRDYLKNPLP